MGGKFLFGVTTSVVSSISKRRGKTATTFLGSNCLDQLMSHPNWAIAPEQI
jgi:hypothetical protein